MWLLSRHLHFPPAMLSRFLKYTFRMSISSYSVSSEPHPGLKTKRSHTPYPGDGALLYKLAACHDSYRNPIDPFDTKERNWITKNPLCATNAKLQNQCESSRQTQNFSWRHWICIAGFWASDSFCIFFVCMFIFLKKYSFGVEKIFEFEYLL